MRCIVKNEEPEDISLWKKKFKNKNKRHATYDDILKETEIKNKLKNALMTEQYSLCGYCCGMLFEDGRNSDIEHIKPKGKAEYAHLSLEYGNLIASCKTKGKNLHCNAAKGDSYDEDCFISPLDEDCSLHFAYLPSSGKVIAKDGDSRAEYMIDLLKLNEDSLKNARIEAYYTSEIPCMGEDELKDYIRTLKMPDCRIPYCNMLLYAAEKRLNDFCRR